MDNNLKIENNLDMHEIHDFEPGGRLKRTRLIFIFIIFFIVLVLAVIVLFFTARTSNSPLAPNVVNQISEKAQEEVVDDVPFKELTIPYLRERIYQSEIGDLDEISSNANYTTFLTDYDSDGLKVNGLLTRPRSDMPSGGWPAIIFVHGYIPPSVYTTTGQSYSDYVNFLARNGFVVFKIDLRGHGNSEGEATGAYYSGDYIVDVLNARAALRNLDFVNNEKIGLWGHSMAGNVTFRSFVVARDIRAVSIWAGAVYTYEDMQEFGIDDNSYRPPADDSNRQRKREELNKTHGQFSKDSEFWQMVVPTNYLDGLKGAIQLNHAVNDDVVNIGYSRNLFEILNKTNIKSEINEYSSGGHNITGSAFNDSMNDTVRFFKENL